MLSSLYARLCYAKGVGVYVMLCMCVASIKLCVCGVCRSPERKLKK